MKVSAAVVAFLFGLGVLDAAAQVRQDRPLRLPGAGQNEAMRLPPPGASQLVCRGGAMPGYEFRQWSPAVSRITVRFNKGSRPARQGLNPGECSWTDRAMGPADPAVFCQDVSDGTVIVNYREDQNYRPPHFYVLQTFLSQSAPYMGSIHQPNYQFTLNVKLQSPCWMVVQ